MKLFRGMLFLLAPLVLVAGCSTHRLCEDELADTKAQLAKTAQLANRMSIQLQQQRAELNSLKKSNVEMIRREKEQAMVQIEAQREDLEHQRFEVNRIRQLEQADLEHQQVE